MTDRLVLKCDSSYEYIQFYYTEASKTNDVG